MIAQTQVSLPAEQVDELRRDAEAMGLDLPAYLAFLRESHMRKHDAAFTDAAKHAFSRYPKTLKKLSE